MLTPPALALPGVSIEQGPSDWQILQADGLGHASVELSGIYRTQAAIYRVQARLVSESDGRPVTTSLDWQDAALLEERRWKLTLSGIPAGGLYRLETRLWRTDCPDVRPMRGDYVHHLGVGDLWLIAGQSNASGTGQGYALDELELGVHQLGNDDQWKLAAHPLEDVTRANRIACVHGVFQAHSPWIAFAKVLKRTLNRPIGLIPTAKGGASMNDWRADGELYQNLLTAVRLAAGQIRGVVWYQGESDASDDKTPLFLDRWVNWISQLRRDLNAPSLAIVSCQLNRYSQTSNHAAWTQIRHLQRQAMKQVDHVALVPTHDLPMGDEVHLTAQSNVVLGQRCAQEALRLVYGQSVRPTGIDLLRIEPLNLPSGLSLSAIDDRGPIVGQGSGDGTGAGALAGNLGGVRLCFSDVPAGFCLLNPKPKDIRILDAHQQEIPLEQVIADDRGWLDLLVPLDARHRLTGTLTVQAYAGADPVSTIRDRDQRCLLAFSESVTFG